MNVTGSETDQIISYILFRSLSISTFLSTFMTECFYMLEI